MFLVTIFSLSISILYVASKNFYNWEPPRLSYPVSFQRLFTASLIALSIICTFFLYLDQDLSTAIKKSFWLILSALFAYIALIINPIVLAVYKKTINNKSIFPLVRSLFIGRDKRSLSYWQTQWGGIDSFIGAKSQIKEVSFKHKTGNAMKFILKALNFFQGINLGLSFFLFLTLYGLAAWRLFDSLLN